MNDTTVTLTGWLGGGVRLRRAGDVPVADFRLASTPRHYQRATGSWVDGETQWYKVTAWRALAEHSARSLRSGDPVVVSGRLTHRTYTDGAGVERVGLEIEATVVGHDLRWGTTTLQRTAKPSVEPTREEPTREEPAPEEPARQESVHEEPAPEEPGGPGTSAEPGTVVGAAA